MSLQTPLECPRDMEEIREGLARVCVPKRELYLREDGVYEPAWAPVFYNPIMIMNRDVTVLTLRVLSGKSRIRRASDLMAATGVRGVRIALEIPSIDEIYMGDIDPFACRNININARLNNVSDRVRLFCGDFNIIAREIVRGGVKIDFNDLDPFGSPAPYIDSAIELTKRKGFLSVTATDIASLSGSYPLKTLRRYYSHTVKTDFSKELGLRVLIGFIVRRGAERDRVLKPLISYYSDHYYKAIFEIDRGAEKSVRHLDKIGYYRYCKKCLYRDTISLREFAESSLSLTCPSCGGKMSLVGPVWLGELGDREFVREIIGETNNCSWIATRDKLVKILSTLEEELSIEKPYYYTTQSIAALKRMNPPSVRYVVECLREKGFKSSRTHFNSMGFKTDAGYREVVECFERPSQSLGM